MDTTLLDQAVAQFQSDRELAPLMAAMAAHFRIPGVAPSIEPYLRGQGSLNGYYFISSFEKCYKDHYSYAQLFDKHGDDPFPAITIGSEEGGVEFWLLLETGQVITLHHDATFFEEATYIRATDGPAFTRRFAEVGSLFTLPQLLLLQSRTGALDRGDDDLFGKGLLKAAAEALGISLRDAAALFSDSRFSFVHQHLGYIYDYEEDLAQFLDEEEPLD